jgi:hypothetical protein
VFHGGARTNTDGNDINTVSSVRRLFRALHTRDLRRTNIQGHDDPALDILVLGMLRPQRLLDRGTPTTTCLPRDHH